MLVLAGHLPVIVWTLWTFVLGASVGSLLNVVIARLPMEKSILWPGSRCGSCLQPIRFRDNVPLLSYWFLRGRCRNCGERFSMQYFLLELLTAVLFAAVYWLEIVADVGGSDFLRKHAWQIRGGLMPWEVWLFMIQRWTLLAFLIAVAGCDIRSREIPLSITLTGALAGLFFSMLLPWPWPEDAAMAPAGNPNWAFLMPPNALPSGAQVWPFWGPAPDGFPFGSVQSGLATGLVGMLVGTFLLRGVRFLATYGLGREALGMGDADLMMMVGAFLGWQAVIVAFFAGALFALLIAVVQVVVFRDDSLPFGPGLAVGSVVTWLCWSSIGPAVRPLFFDATILVIVFGAGGVMLFGLCWLLGKLRGPVDDPAAG